MQRSAPLAIASRIATASVVWPGFVPPMTTTGLSSNSIVASFIERGIVPETVTPASARDSLTMVAFRRVAAIPILSSLSSLSIMGLASVIPSLAGAPPPTTIPILSSTKTLSRMMDTNSSNQACRCSTSGLSRLPPSARTMVAIGHSGVSAPFNAFARYAREG